MNSTFASIAIIFWLAVTFAAAFTFPIPFSDENDFLKGFVNHELLSFMGLIVTITLASAANVFVELNKLEEKDETLSFPNTKRDLKHSSYALIGCLAASLFIVLTKPWLSPLGNGGATFSNCLAIGTILFAMMIMLDLLTTSFSLEPRPKG